jgi:hypothetical protein
MILIIHILFMKKSKTFIYVFNIYEVFLLKSKTKNKID